LVEVRRGQWGVTGGRVSLLGNSNPPRRHYPALLSIEEDDPGEQIKVVLEIEPGLHFIECAGSLAMTGQDYTDELETFPDAVLRTAATNADRGFLLTPFHGGASIEDFQLDRPVRTTGIADANLLIADDVGLGRPIWVGFVMDFQNMNTLPVELREFQGEIDREVTVANSWDDIDIGHGFFKIPLLPDNDAVRFSISEQRYLDVLHLLRVSNPKRCQEEQVQAMPRVGTDEAMVVCWAGSGFDAGRSPFEVTSGDELDRSQETIQEFH